MRGRGGRGGKEEKEGVRLTQRGGEEEMVGGLRWRERGKEGGIGKGAEGILGENEV